MVAGGATAPPHPPLSPLERFALSVVIMDGGSGGAPVPPHPPRAPLERFALSVVILDGGSGGAPAPPHPPRAPLGRFALSVVMMNGVDFLNPEVQKPLTSNFEPNRSNFFFGWVGGGILLTTILKINPKVNPNINPKINPNS